MADYYYGKISIPACCLTEEKRKLINEEMESLQDYTLDEMTQEHEDGDLILVFSKDQLRDGQHESLESALIQYQVPFDRYSSGHYEFQPETRYYRPGLDDRTVVESEHDGEYIPNDKVKELIAVILDEDKGRDDAIAMAKKLQEEHTSEGIKPLEDYIEGVVQVGEN